MSIKDFNPTLEESLYTVDYFDFFQDKYGNPEGWLRFFVTRFCEELYMLCTIPVQECIKMSLINVLKNTDLTSLRERVQFILYNIRLIDDNLHNDNYEFHQIHNQYNYEFILKKWNVDFKGVYV